MLTNRSNRYKSASLRGGVLIPQQVKQKNAGRMAVTESDPVSVVAYRSHRLDSHRPRLRSAQDGKHRQWFGVACLFRSAASFFTTGSAWASLTQLVRRPLGYGIITPLNGDPHISIALNGNWNDIDVAHCLIIYLRSSNRLALASNLGNDSGGTDVTGTLIASRSRRTAANSFAFASLDSILSSNWSISS